MFAIALEGVVSIDHYLCISTRASIITPWKPNC